MVPMEGNVYMLEEIKIDEYIAELNAMGVRKEPFFDGSASIRWKGRPTIAIEGNIYMFICCDYCGGRKSPYDGLYGGYYCSDCNAPV